MLIPLEGARYSSVATVVAGGRTRTPQPSWREPFIGKRKENRLATLGWRGLRRRKPLSLRDPLYLRRNLQKRDSFYNPGIEPGKPFGKVAVKVPD